LRTLWYEQKEPKSLPLGIFPGLKIYQKSFCGRASALDPLEELTTLHRLPGWILRFTSDPGLRENKRRDGMNEKERRKGEE